MKRLMLLFVMVVTLFLFAGKQISADGGEYGCPEIPDFCYTGWEVYQGETSTMWCCSMLQQCWIRDNNCPN